MLQIQNSHTNRPPDAKSPPNYRNNSLIPQPIIHTWKTMDIYSGHLLPCYLLSIDHHCNLSLVPIPIPIILKSPSMDSSLRGDAFPSRCHDAMPQSVRWRRQLGGGSLVAAARRRRRQREGGDGSVAAVAAAQLRWAAGWQGGSGGDGGGSAVAAAAAAASAVRRCR